MNEHPSKIIELPAPSLVMLLGARGCGMSTFAARHFDPSAIVSLDVCRQLIGDDRAGFTASAAAMELFLSIIDKRLDAAKLVVVDTDATNAELRRTLVAMARRHHLFAIAIAFDFDVRICLERNAARTDCMIPPHVVKRQSEAMRAAMKGLLKDGIRDVHVLSSPRDAEAAKVVSRRLWTDRRDEHGPFDIIGDVHGCADELEALLETLGYRITWDNAEQWGVRVTPPQGRRIIFLGDLIDRGPRIVDTLRIAMSMVHHGDALCVPGNHEVKLLKKLRGKQVSITHGLAETLTELERTDQNFRDELASFIEKLVGHYLLDDGKLCVVHAGIKERMLGRSSSAAREFGLYGDTTGETDEYGLPVRHEWASAYQGNTCIVFGHTPMLTAEWLNNTICIDTGCVFGGALTALRYPERELVSVPALRRYFEPKKPLTSRTSKAGAEPLSIRQPAVDFDFDPPKAELLDYEILRNGGVFTTRFQYDVPIHEENAVAAIEMLSRFCVDPRWLVYLPPAVSPVDRSSVTEAIEHPSQAFAYYRKKGISRVVCLEKRVSTTVVVVVCRDKQAAQNSFGVQDGRTGMIYTRSGRAYFDDRAVELAFVERLRQAVETSGVFRDFGPYVVFEADLVAERHHRPEPADLSSIEATMDALALAARRGIDIAPLRERLARRKERLERFASGSMNWVDDEVRPDNRRLVPTQILATEGISWLSRNFSEIATCIHRFVEADPVLFMGQPTCDVMVGDASSERAGISFWDDVVSQGGAGVIVKPFEFMGLSRRGLLLPALLCRSSAVLRAAMGPEYDTEENLQRIAKRSLGSLRSVALGQHALGMESLARFVERAPLSRVHACFCVALALECENLDSRT